MSEQRHYAPRTITLRLTAIKTFLAYASHEDITLIALSQTAKPLRAPASPRTPIEYLTNPKPGPCWPRTPAPPPSHAATGCC